MTAKYDVLQIHVIIWKKRRSLFGALHRLNLHITSLLFPSDANQRTANEVDFGKIPLRFLGMAPRVHLGTSIGTSGEASQFFTGFTWTVDLNEKLFLPKPGFGGVIHTGDLEGDGDCPELGCRVHFHEYLGA